MAAIAPLTSGLSSLSHKKYIFKAIKLPALQLTAPIVEEGCKIAKSIILARTTSQGDFTPS
jgi:hypothetical protein